MGRKFSSLGFLFLEFLYFVFFGRFFGATRGNLFI